MIDMGGQKRRHFRGYVSGISKIPIYTNLVCVGPTLLADASLQKFIKNNIFDEGAGGGGAVERSQKRPDPMLRNLTRRIFLQESPQETPWRGSWERGACLSSCSGLALRGYRLA